MSTIPSEEVLFHPSSGSDWNGRVFEWNHDIYRAIGPCYVDVLAKLLHEGVLPKLTEQGLLIQTEVTPLHLDGYPMVVKHRRLPFVSYAAEWSATMMKDVALLLIDLERELVPFGLSNHDVNPWNVLFDWTKPIFVDLGALMPLETDTIWPATKRNAFWPAHDQFCQLILYPLYLMSWGHARIARSLLNDYKGVLKAEFLKLSPHAPCRHQTALPQLGRSVARRVAQMAQRYLPQTVRSVVKTRLLRERIAAPGPKPDIASRLRFLDRCRQEVESIKLEPSDRYWSDYYNAFHGGQVPPFNETPEWTVKNHNVFKILRALGPQTILDMGSNTGWYSQLAATNGNQVVAFDTDETCVDQLYYRARTNNLAVLPLVMDFRSPSPGAGPCNNWLLPATERLQCDMVLALAVVHHLVSKRYLTFGQIAQTLSMFAKRRVLVEFMPPEDQYVRDWRTREFDWYTTDNFLSSLKQHFSRLQILESYPSPRKLILCER